MDRDDSEQAHGEIIGYDYGGVFLPVRGARAVRIHEETCARLGPTLGIGPRGPGLQADSRDFGGGIMSQAIEVESIRRLDIKPGELLVATLPARATRQEMDQVRVGLQQHLPDGVRLVIMSEDIELSVVADGCPSSPA